MKKKIFVICLILVILLIALFLSKPSLKTHKEFIKDKIHANLNAASNQNNSQNYFELEDKLKHSYFPILQENNYYLFSIVKTPIDREFETVTLGIAGLIIPLYNFDINKSYKKSSIEINITSNKGEYSLIEPVWITIQFKNTGTSVDSVDVFGELQLYPNFLITDMYGNELKYHYYLADYSTPNIIILEKNVQKSYDLELSIAYGNIPLKGKYMPDAYFSEGKYSVMLKHGTDYLKEIIYSNKIKFSSKTPENYDLNIFNRLNDIIKIYDVKFTNWESYISDLKKMYYDNKSNVYSEEIFYNYFQKTLMILDIPEHKEYGKLFDDRFIGECEAFLDKYPDTYYSGKILEGLIPNFVRRLNKSKSEAYYYLKGLMIKYPNTKIHSAVIDYLSNTKYINRFFERRRNRDLNKKMSWVGT